MPGPARAVGGLVGSNYGSVTDCCSAGEVSGDWDIGGLVGGSGGNITNCCSTAAVSGLESVGGLVGYNSAGSIINCYATGAVDGDSDSQYIGGLVGANMGSIKNSCSNGTVGASSNSERIGGLVGYNVYGSIINSYSTGNINGASDCSYVGGLVGYNYADVVGCYSAGNVIGSSYVGGLTGYNYYAITDSYSTGTASGTSHVGGLAGRAWGGVITNCYSTGAVSGTSDTGALIGSKSGGGSLTSSYFLSGAGPDNGFGTPLTDAQMKQQASFIDWDFVAETANGSEDIWRMCVDGIHYPFLWWQFNPADFTCPDGVNVEDLDYFVQRWLWDDCTSSNDCDGADMNVSGEVEFADFAMFAQNWLQQE